MGVFLGPTPILLPFTSLAAAQAARAAAGGGAPAAAANAVTPQMFTAAAFDSKLYAVGGKWLYEWFFDSPIDTSTLKLNQDVFERGIKSIVRRLPSPWGIAGGVIGGYGLIRAAEKIAERFLPDYFE